MQMTSLQVVPKTETHHFSEDALAIYHYDVVVVGGGIAGISIAELLSRKSKLRIKVLDHAPQLGLGASGRLEGWFHSGALYSGSDDPATFMNCVNAIQDLITFYSSYFINRCNMVLGKKREDVYVPVIDDLKEKEKWFNDSHVYYILPHADAPDIKLSPLKNDRILWKIQSQRVLNRLESTFGEQNSWIENGKCKAPAFENIEKFAGPSTLFEPTPELEKLCLRHDAFHGVRSRYDYLKSADVSMNTPTILGDLVASAMQNGVHFDTNTSIENLVVDGTNHIKSLLCRNRYGMKEHLKAKLFIFSVGSGFESLLKELRLRIKLTINKSAMVLASPPLSLLNFVRMSPKAKFHFNHFCQQGTTALGNIFRYSILANSRFWKDHLDWREHVEPEQVANDTDSLLEMAEHYFGEEELYSRSLYSYNCFKTEFITEEEEKRRYSYWIEFNDKTNYICVLPGKFTFFPTVAYQTYLKIKSVFNFSEMAEPSRYVPNPEVEKAAKALLADHQALRILSSDTAQTNSVQESKKRRAPIAYDLT